MVLITHLTLRIEGDCSTTLTVCLQGKDAIVVAADSRGTFGDLQSITAQNDTIKKVYLVGKVGISMAGATNANMVIEEVAKAYQNGDGVTATMYKLRETSRSRFDDWFAKFALLPSKDNPNIVRPHLQLSIAGYDLENGKPIPRLYSMVSNYDFAPNLHDFGFVVSGLVQYALYLLNRLYSINMDTETLKHLGAYVITETATQDGRVGGPVQMAVITPAGAPTMLNKVDVQSIITQNEDRSKRLNELFRSE